MTLIQFLERIMQEDSLTRSLNENQPKHTATLKGSDSVIRTTCVAQCVLMILFYYYEPPTYYKFAYNKCVI